jgi:hypothetical protein
MLKKFERFYNFPMHHNNDFLINMFQRNVNAIKQFTLGFDHAASLIQPPLGANCANWLLGHLLYYRNRLFTITGRPMAIDPAIAARYPNGSKAVLGDEPALGKWEDMLAAFEASQEPLAASLKAMTQEEADKVWTFTSTANTTSMTALEWHVYFMRHEAYHAGQFEWMPNLLKTRVG